MQSPSERHLGRGEGWEWEIESAERQSSGGLLTVIILYLAAVVGAELVTAFVSPVAGTILHLGVLLSLLLHSALGKFLLMLSFSDHQSIPPSSIEFALYNGQSSGRHGIIDQDLLYLMDAIQNLRNNPFRC